MRPPYDWRREGMFKPEDIPWFSITVTIICVVIAVIAR